jgi:hypothetical protein
MTRATAVILRRASFFAAMLSWSNAVFSTCLPAGLPRSSQELATVSSSSSKQQGGISRSGSGSKLRRAWPWVTERRQGSYSKGQAQLQVKRQCMLVCKCCGLRSCAVVVTIL